MSEETNTETTESVESPAPTEVVCPVDGNKAAVERPCPVCGNVISAPAVTNG